MGRRCQRLIAILAVVAPAIIAEPAYADNHVQPAFIAAGRAMEPPHGYLAMCETGGPFCPAATAIDKRPVQDGFEATGAIRSLTRLVDPMELAVQAASPPRPTGSRPSYDAGIHNIADAAATAKPANPVFSLVGELRDVAATTGSPYQIPTAEPFALQVEVVATMAANIGMPPAIALVGILPLAPTTIVPTDPVVVKDERKLLRRINLYVNRHVRQETDMDAFGVGELWRASGTGRQAVGDCEDLAIEKRLELVAAGFDPDRLFFAVVYRRTLGLHTVLVAHLDTGDVVLDSQSDVVRDWRGTGYSWISIQDRHNPAAWYGLNREAQAASVDPNDDRRV